MPFINYQNKEITFKIVYYGPGMSGKTTNLSYIHQQLNDEIKGEMIILDTDQDRTLFFDYFPLYLGNIDGFEVKFNMFTVPGQVYYEASRKLILDGTDGVVFVADSNPRRLSANLKSYNMMLENLRYYNFDPTEYPLVLQYNKRDLDEVIPLGFLEEKLEIKDVPAFEAVALRGKGVMETIKSLSRMVIMKFKM